ncbi:MAG TPA: MGMT family protein [Marmoricola sp.]|nr:MGMT family protein [Marmoricola sp.]
MPDEDYIEAVLTIVEQIPEGCVTTYGLIAEAIFPLLGRGGPRQVGAVMAGYGGPVPWWRVVRADGSLPPSHDHHAHQEYLGEGTPLRPSGAVDLRKAIWLPPESSTEKP